MTINKLTCGTSTGAQLVTSVNETIDLSTSANTNATQALNAVNSFEGVSPTVINNSNVRKFGNELRKLEDKENTTKFVTLTGYGDSMAGLGGYVLSCVLRSLQLRYGLGGFFTSGFGQTWPGSSWAFTGGANQPINDFTYLPSACQLNMPVGSSATTDTKFVGVSGNTITEGSFSGYYNQLDGKTKTLNITKVRFYYLNRVNDGSLTFTVSQDGTTGYSPVTVDCNSSLNVMFSDILVLDSAQPIEISVSCADAASIFIGAVFYREKGVLGLNSNVGGTTMTQQNVYIDNGNDTTIYKTLCDSLNTKLVIHAQRAGDDTDYQANYTKVFDMLETELDADQVVIGEGPRDPEPTITVAVMNAYLRAQCVARGCIYFEQTDVIGKSLQALVDLGWADDVIHYSAPLHRFVAASILQSVDYFRFAGNNLDIDPLSMGQLLDRMIQVQTAMLARQSTITARANTTVDQGSYANSWAYTASNASGFQFSGGSAGLGHAVAEVGRVATGLEVDTTASSYSTVVTGYRNLQLRTGTRAFFAVGTNSVFSSVEAITNNCYGFECALGSDINNAGGTNEESMRLFYYNGTSIVYGSWVSCRTSGVGQVSQTGLNASVVWSLEKQRLELYSSYLSSHSLRSILNASYLATNKCSRASIVMGVFANDADNVPTVSCKFSANEIKTISTLNAFGIVGNDL